MNTLCTPPVKFFVYSEIIFTSLGFETSIIIIPFFLFEAPSRLITHILPSLETLTSLTVLASTLTLSIFLILAGSVTSQKYDVPSAPQVPVTA